MPPITTSYWITWTIICRETVLSSLWQMRWYQVREVQPHGQREIVGRDILHTGAQQSDGDGVRGFGLWGSMVIHSADDLRQKGPQNWFATFHSFSVYSNHPNRLTQIISRIILELRRHLHEAETTSEWMAQLGEDRGWQDEVHTRVWRKRRYEIFIQFCGKI